MPPRRFFLLTTVAFHFGLIGIVCCRDTFTVVREGGTNFPESWRDQARACEHGAETMLGEYLPSSSPIRQLVAGYLNLAGIEAGYGFFAPHVPAANELVFELHYGNGRVEYERSPIRSRAAALRVTSLLDLIARAENEEVRKGLIKYLAYAVWRQHRDVATIRVLLETINYPPSSRFARGAVESYRASHVYDFTFELEPGN